MDDADDVGRASESSLPRLLPPAATADESDLVAQLRAQLDEERRGRLALQEEIARLTAAVTALATGRPADTTGREDDGRQESASDLRRRRRG